MRVMGLDVGDKKIGVAMSDPMLVTAHGRPTLMRKNLTADLEQLRQLVEENEVHEIVVGKPLHMDGRSSPQSEKVARFARELQNLTSLPIVFIDERLTSFEAEQRLEELGFNWRKRRQHVDELAAMLILQEYLDSRPRP